MPGRIRIALVGVGNSACALVQGMDYYGEDDSRKGLWHTVIGGYRVSDLEVVEAFDIDVKKIDMDVSEAIFFEPNVAPKYLEPKPFNVAVRKGILKDDLTFHLGNTIRVDNREARDLVDILRSNKVDVMVNLISSGLDHSSEAYADIALEAGCCFVNATTTSMASNENMCGRFLKYSLVIVGDDLMSQFGGTIFHKGILNFMHKRGTRIERSYQLDVGGGMETLNTVNERLKLLKRDMKTKAIAIELPYDFETVAGTTDYVDFMNNNRTSYFWIEGEGFLGSQISVDVYLRTVDGPNAGNVLLDTIRAVKVAKDSGDFGAPLEICNYAFKKPPDFIKLEDIYERFYSKYGK